MITPRKCKLCDLIATRESGLCSPHDNLYRKNRRRAKRGLLPAENIPKPLSTRPSDVKLREKLRNDTVFAWWHSHRSSTNKIGMKSLITLDECRELFEKQEYKCNATGVSFEWRSNSDNSPTFDRLKAGGPYAINNVRIVTKRVNQLRGNRELSYTLLLDGTCAKNGLFSSMG